MRREWSGWIRGRQWDELERVAKREPSQDLADTVRELELGLTDKADRRALRKILFLLANAGFRPTPIEDQSAAPEVAPRFEIAFMVSADASGDSVVTYGVEERGRVRWLVAHLNGARGVTRAGEEEQPLDRARAHVERLRQTDPRPFVSAEVPADFALGRIAEAVRGAKSGLPSVIAFWRGRLDGAPVVPHPGEKLPRAADTTSEDRRRAALAMDESLLWRLELGVASPVLRELQAVRAEAVDADDRKAKTEAAITRVRAQLFTPEVRLDHETRLLDLAYLLHLRGREGSPLLLAALDDLRERGADSDYARGVLDKTVVLLVNTLEAGRVSDAGPA